MAAGTGQRATQGQLPVQAGGRPGDGCRYRPTGWPGAAAGTGSRGGCRYKPTGGPGTAAGTGRQAGRGRLPVQAQGRLPVQAGGRLGGGCRYKPAFGPGAARNGCRYKPETGSRYQLAQAAPIHAGVPRTLSFFIPVPGGPGSPDSYRCPADTPPPMDHGGRQAAATGVQRTPPLRGAMGAGRVRLRVSSGHPPSDGPWGQAGCGYRCPADTPLRWAMGAGRVRLPVSSGHPPSDGPWGQAGRGCRRPADTPP